MKTTKPCMDFNTFQINTAQSYCLHLNQRKYLAKQHKQSKRSGKKLLLLKKTYSFKRNEVIHLKLC